MTHITLQAVEKSLATKKKSPVLRAGYRVKVHQKIREGEKERVQIFEGLVIAINQGAGVSKTITVRKEVEGIGVEKIFPIFSPNVVKIEVVKTLGVRRAKLYYVRNSRGISARLRAKLGLVARDEKMTGIEDAKVNAKAQAKEVAPEVVEAVATPSDVEPEKTIGA